MPRKYQNGKLEIRRNVARPYYFVRVTIPKISEDGERKPKREARVLGFLEEISLRDAKLRRAELLEVVNAGRVVATSQASFLGVVERFVDVRLPQLGIAAQSKYRSQIENHILPTFGGLRIGDIDRPAVEAWMNAKEAAGLSWWTRIDLKGVLSAIFTTAKSWKLWEGDNPTEGIRIGRKKEVRELSKKSTLTAAQIQAILAAVSEETRLMIIIAVVVGLRISEIMGLRWSDIDFEVGTLTVNRRWYRGDLDEPKTEASQRTRKLGPLALLMKARYPGPHKRDAYIFVGDDGIAPGDERDILRHELRPALKRLKLYYQGFGWHQFRRNSITLIQTAGGASPLEAQKSAGHTQISTTMAYTLIDGDRETEQVTRMFDMIMGTGHGQKH